MRPVQALTHYWDVGTLAWIKGTQPAGGGGGGAATIADGADVALGATTDAAVVTDTTGTVSGKLRGLVKWAFERMPASLGQKTGANSFPVTIASDDNIHAHIHPEQATGTSSATNTPVAIAMMGKNGAGARIVPSAGTYSGTFVFEATMDDTNWFNVQFVVIATGRVAEGVTYVTGVSTDGGFTTHHLSAILPSGVTQVRVRNSVITAGSIAITLNAVGHADVTQRFIGANSITPGPTQGLQLGGSATPGTGEFKVANVVNVNPGISASRYGLVVVPWGLIDPGGSAGGYPYRLVGGRDPNTNAMRQMDLIAGAITSTGWNGLVVRPYMGSDGTNMMPTMDADARRGYVDVIRWLGSTAPTVGQKAMASSIPVVLASGQSVPVTWTATAGSLTSLSADGDSSFGSLDGNPGADLYLNLVGLTGTLSVIVSGSGSLLSTCQFVDGSGVRRTSKAYTAATATEAWSLILPPGASVFAVRLATHSAGSVDFEFSVSQTAQPYRNIPSLSASSPAAATVGVASAQAVAANANRRGCVLVNTSAVNISLGFGATAVLNSGITLVPNAAFTMDEFTLHVGAINAIAGAVASNLSVQEFTA